MINDAAGNELNLGDFVMFASGNKLRVGQITKITHKFVGCQPRLFITVLAKYKIPAYRRTYMPKDVPNKFYYRSVGKRKDQLVKAPNGKPVDWETLQ